MWLFVEINSLPFLKRITKCNDLLLHYKQFRPDKQPQCSNVQISCENCTKTNFYIKCKLKKHLNPGV